MPSPFPGMDPFLEHPEIFPDLHDSFVTYLRESLQHSLPEPYFATIGTRSRVDFAHRAIGPDVKVLLPTIGIPLLPEHQPVSLDLQAILDRCYEAGPYRRNVRYREAAIVPPLSPERTAWAMQLLREKGVVA